jgi:protein-S-isoprenylcysteine O-methyltransferase Ste14
MSQMEAAARPLCGPVTIKTPVVTWAGLGHAFANVLLAASFFVAALPSANQRESGVASTVWIAGAIIMGFFSLVRAPAKSAMLTIPAFAASAGMLVVPCLMRPATPSTGLWAAAGIVFEVTGVAFSQSARICMGRRFGILPANRGIVSKGPFSIVRHPIYLGWLILTIGFALSYPSLSNVILIFASLPFMVWRIEMEEALLAADSDYRVYQHQVRFRLVPGVV